MTDNEIIKAREVSLKEQIEHYKERKKEVFESYYRRNTEGNEDTLEICVLRESAVLISKLESIINRQKAEIERYRETVGELVVEDDGVVELLKGEKTKYIKEETAEIAKRTAVEYAKAEAYKEFADRLKNILRNTPKWNIQKNNFKNVGFSYDEVFFSIDNLLKEMVGEDNA